MTYRWISEFTFARNATIRPHRETGEDDDPVREDEPIAEVAELPRHESVAGEQSGSRGKPWYDVFAASTRIASVNACSR